MNTIFSSHRHKLIDGEVIAERSVTSVTPGLFVNGHAVFPFVLEQVSWLVAIRTSVISTVCADGAIAPPIIRYHRVTYWTVEKISVSSVFISMMGKKLKIMHILQVYLSL